MLTEVLSVQSTHRQPKAKAAHPMGATDAGAAVHRCKGIHGTAGHAGNQIESSCYTSNV